MLHVSLDARLVAAAEGGAEHGTGADTNIAQHRGVCGAGGVSSYPAEPAAARVVVRNGKVLLKSGINGSIIAVSYEARARGVTRWRSGA